MQCDIIGHEGPSSHAMHPRLHRVAIYSADTQYFPWPSQSVCGNTERSMAMSVSVSVVRRSVRAARGRTKITCVFGNLHVRRRADAAAGKECNIVSNPAVATRRVLVLLFGSNRSAS